MTAPAGTTTVRPGGIARAAITVAVITIAARTIGFARLIVFAHTVGPSCLGDTYYTANTVPNILFDIVAGGALTSIVVPLLAGPAERGDDETADRTASALLTWSVLLLVPVLAVGVLAARPIMDLLVGNGHPGCSAALEQSVGARMLTVFMPQVVLYGAGIVLTGVLQAHRRFAAPALGPLVSSLVVIGTYLVFAADAQRRETALSTLTRGHELLLSLGTTAGVVALVVPSAIALRGTGRRLRPTLRFPAGVARTARRLALAGAVVVGSQDVATGVALRLANDRGSDGAVVLFNLAWTVFLLPWAVLAVPLATAAFPTLAARAEAGDDAGFSHAASTTARAVVLAGAAAAAVLVAIAEPLARVVVLGAPGGVAPSQLARALVAFAPGVIGFGLIAHLSRVLYAAGDARTPAIATAIGWLLAVVTDVVLVVQLPRTWTATALAAGTSVGVSVTAVWLALRLRHRRELLTGVAAGLLRALGCAAVAAAAARLVAEAAGAGAIIRSAVVATGVAVLCAVMFGAATYAVDRPALMLVFRRGRRA